MEGFMIKSPDSGLLLYTAAITAEASIQRYFKLEGIVDVSKLKEWQELMKDGYTCVPFDITECKK